MKFTLRRFVFSTICLSATVQAADITWDITPGTVGGGNGSITGGTGAWDLALGNWTTDAGTNNIAWDNTLNAADTAVFQGTGGTVTLGTTIYAGGLRFAVAGYTVAGQTINFGNALGSINSSAIGTGSSLATVSSALTGTAGLTIAANGNTSASGGSSTARLILSGNNTGLTGGIAITGGLVNFSSSSAAGSAATTAGSGNTLTLSNGGGIYNSAALTLGNSIILSSTGGGTLRSSSGQTLTLNGVVSGTGGFNKTDSGTVSLDNTGNTFSGTVNVQAGTLQLNTTAGGGGAYAFAASAINVSSGATLAIKSNSSGSGTYTNNFLGLGSNAISVSGGNINFSQSANSSQVFNAALDFSGTSTVNFSAGSFSTHTVNLAKNLTGSTGTLTFTTSGSGTARNFAINGAANNYTGGLVLGTAAVLSAFNLNTTIGVSDLTINDVDWTVNLSNATHTFKSLNSTVNAAIAGTGANSVLNVGSGNGSDSYSGRLTGTLSLIKTGTGTLTLGGANTYSGTTTVEEGKLLVNGSAVNSAFTVNDGGTIGGSGSIGALTVTTGGFVGAGNSPGILSTGNFSLEGGATLLAELAGATAGTGYDQLNVTGTVNLSGLLAVSASFSPSATDLFFIIVNDGADAITGTFDGLANESIVSIGGQDYQISYFADSTGNTFTGGNDVALMLVPEPGIALLSGLGVLGLLRRRR